LPFNAELPSGERGGFLAAGAIVAAKPLPVIGAEFTV